MAYDFKVLAVGTSSWSFLEGVASHLEQILGEAQVQEIQNQGYELWQVNTLNDKQGNDQAHPPPEAKNERSCRRSGAAPCSVAC